MEIIIGLIAFIGGLFFFNYFERIENYLVANNQTNYTSWGKSLLIITSILGACCGGIGLTDLDSSIIHIICSVLVLSIIVSALYFSVVSSVSNVKNTFLKALFMVLSIVLVFLIGYIVGNGVFHITQ